MFYFKTQFQLCVNVVMWSALEDYGQASDLARKY